MTPTKPKSTISGMVWRAIKDGETRYYFARDEAIKFADSLSITHMWAVVVADAEKFATELHIIDEPEPAPAVTAPTTAPVSATGSRLPSKSVSPVPPSK